MASTSAATDVCDIHDITALEVEQAVVNLRKVFLTGKTRSLDWRVKQLKQLKLMLEAHKADILDAICKDLGKQSTYEPRVSDYSIVYSTLTETISNIKTWTAPESASTPMWQNASSEIRSEPLGVVLIMSPWNYPVNLALVPLIGSIAAGNVTFLKLSPASAHTAATLHRLLTKYLDCEALVVESKGSRTMIKEILKHKFNHIFFTGSVGVGKIVYEAAAKHMTTVTLELGGKNPAVVADDCNTDVMSRRICWGKYFNAGQTCIAPDHVYMMKGVYVEALNAIKKTLAEFYGDQPKESRFFSRCINQANAERLERIIKDPNVEVLIGGEVVVSENYVAPTVLLVKDPVNALCMQEEIFGPILPVLLVDTFEEAVERITWEASPLTLYLFSSSSQRKDYLLARTRSGSCVVNDCLLQFTNPNLPFGGIGDSGIGAYHKGNLTFKTLSHSRPVVTAGTRMDIPLRYPPYPETGFSSWLTDTLT